MLPSVLPSRRSRAPIRSPSPRPISSSRTTGWSKCSAGSACMVVEGAAQTLRERDREIFLKEEWPEIRERMTRLGLAPEKLLAE